MHRGSKNILIANPKKKNRVQAYYPYLAHAGISTLFSFINEPSINRLSDADWSFTFLPKNPAEKSIFDSWVSTMNISTRYYDFFRKNIFPMWENDYKRFIEEDHAIKHAATINDLKGNLKIWKASFPVKGRPGALLYRSFIDYLINNASTAYLYSLCENFKRA